MTETRNTIDEIIDDLSLSLDFPENFPPNRTIASAIVKLKSINQSAFNSFLPDLRSAVSDIEDVIYQMERAPK